MDPFLTWWFSVKEKELQELKLEHSTGNQPKDDDCSMEVTDSWTQPILAEGSQNLCLGGFHLDDTAALFAWV